jgi:hypothetical protein
MASERRQKLGPFGRPAGIGHVAGDEHQVERPLGVDGVEPVQKPLQPAIAARPGASALDAKSVALADRVQVREVRDTPRPTAGRRSVEGAQVTRLIHGRIGEPPRERGRRKIAPEEHDGIRQRREHEALGPGQVPDIADPACSRPCERHDPQGDGTSNQSGAGRRCRTQARMRFRTETRAEQVLRQVLQTLPAKRVAGLDGQGVERPEALFGSAPERTPANPC